MKPVAYAVPMFLACSAAFASEASNLPIRSGRWSSDSCAKPSEATTRFFKPGWTSTPTNRCALSAVAATDEGERTYRAHLTCSSDQDDVVLKVSSQTSLTWINQCMAVEYRYCGQAPAEAVTSRRQP